MGNIEDRENIEMMRYVNGMSMLKIFSHCLSPIRSRVNLLDAKQNRCTQSKT